MQKLIVLYLSLSLLVLNNELLAQKNTSPSKINFFLQQIIDNPQKSYEQIHLFVRGDIEQIKSTIVKMGGYYKYGYNNIAAVRLPVDKIEAFSHYSFVDRMEVCIDKGQPLNDTMLINNNVYPSHQGTPPLLQTYDGEGVVLGFIDTGIEIRHPDFKDKDGNTRILYIWDQTQGYNPARTPFYGYGQVWDSTDINRDSCTHIDPANHYSHGSTVAGTGAGNGRAVGDFTGVAPKADIIMVATSFSASNWSGTVADAVDFIFKKADALGKPCVINTSVGTYYGSHDGQDATSQIIDGLIKAKKGRVLVCAAGNAGGKYPPHLGYDVTSDTSFTWFKYNINNSIYAFAGVTFDLWADTSDFNNVQFAIGADKNSPTYSFRGRTKFFNIKDSLGGWVNDSIMNDTNVLAYVNYWANLDAFGKYFLHIRIKNPDSSQYYFRFITTGQGRFDIWSANWIGLSDMVRVKEIPTFSTFPDIAHYKAPDSLKNLVSSWPCSPNVITVANYNNRSTYLDYNGTLQKTGVKAGMIAVGSSGGPTRTSLMKPDITASGDNTLSASRLNASLLSVDIAGAPSYVAKGGMHRKNGGTSIAAPVVAGIAALYLQKCPSASHMEVLNAITSTAKEDDQTNTVPNYRWGYGKIDGYAALSSSSYNPILTTSGLTYICEGEVIQLATNANNYSSYIWSTNEITQNINISDSGIFYVTTTDSSGCKGLSDTVITQWYANPPLPTISTNPSANSCGEADTITLSVPPGYFSYLWSTASTKISIEVTQDGSYYALVKGINDCEVSSDTVQVSFTSTPLQPSITKIQDTLYSTLAENYQWYRNKILLNDTNATKQWYHPILSGYYAVETTDGNGCTAMSDTINILLDAINNFMLNTSIIIYPNPTSGEFTLELLDIKQQIMNYEIKILNLLGQTIYHNKLEAKQNKLDISKSPKGIYTLQLISDRGVINKKIITE